jgi:hypothetical protein
LAAQPATSPPERLFGEDIAGCAFAVGVDRGHWRLVCVDWPYAVIEIKAAPRPGSPDWLALRFLLSGYPQAPSAQPWDIEQSSMLDPGRWPGGSDRILGAFRPEWRPDALYMPMDGLALEAHPDWQQKYARDAWDPGKDITQYLRAVHELINQDGYSGVRAPA